MLEDTTCIANKLCWASLEEIMLALLCLESIRMKSDHLIEKVARGNEG